MEKQVFMASCPVCGRSLFKGTADSYIEGGCPKCKSYLRISYTPQGVLAAICAARTEQQNTGMPKR